MMLAAALLSIGVAPTMRLSLPTGPLTNLFAPGGTADFQHAFFCFTLGRDGMPTFVHGTAQMYWYFEGPIDASRMATLTLYAVNAFNGKPIMATLTLGFSSVASKQRLGLTFLR